jgi:hypothetical protein
MNLMLIAASRVFSLDQVSTTTSWSYPCVQRQHCGLLSDRGAACCRSWCWRGRTTGRTWRWCGSCSANSAWPTAATAAAPSWCSAAGRSWCVVFSAPKCFCIPTSFRRGSPLLAKLASDECGRKLLHPNWFSAQQPSACPQPTSTSSQCCRRWRTCSGAPSPRRRATARASSSGRCTLICWAAACSLSG